MKDIRKLKILFIPAWYPNKENPISGIFIKELAHAVSMYNEVVIIYSRLTKKDHEEISDKLEDNIRTIRTCYRKTFIPNFSFLIYIWNIYQSFNKLKKEGWLPDIIHAHIFIAGFPALLLSKIYKIPLIISEHWSYIPLKKLNFFERVIVKFVLKRARIILPVSNSLKKGIQDYGIKNSFHLIPNVINTKLFYPSQKKSSEAKKKILYVGLFTHIKGISYLLKAIALLKLKRNDFILDIIGNGPKKEEYLTLVKQLNIQGVVKFHGSQNKKTVAKFIKNCDFFVQPSLYETFNVACIEAMACGKPIVATKISAFEEKINKDRGILVPFSDSKKLAKAIEYMLEHYNEYSIKKISNYVKNNYSYKVVGKILTEIYYKICFK